MQEPLNNCLYRSSLLMKYIRYNNPVIIAIISEQKFKSIKFIWVIMAKFMGIENSLNSIMPFSKAG